MRMLPRGLTRKRKRISPLGRILLVLLSLVLIFSSGIFDAEAKYLVPMDQIPKLQKVGPIHHDNGYPVWYKDHKGTKLQLCLDQNDPLCAMVPEDIPDPTKPISLEESNFPVEAFYQLAGSEIDLPNGGRAVATFALEAAWANEIVQDGDQIVFGRVRFRIDGLKANETYVITHPYGKDEFTAEVGDEDEPDAGEIRFVEDIGVQGGFEGPLKSRIGSFLEWDEGAPDGYVGDPNVDHKVKGGYHNGIEEQNYFKIEGPGIGEGAPIANQCKDAQGNVIGDCIQTDLFSLMGKRADNSGVDIARATYSRNVAEDGTPIDGGTIDVFASTAEGDDEDIVVSADGIDQVKLEGANGYYFARITFKGESPPALITVTNRSDTPDTVKTFKPVDKINATANYDVKSKTLTVNAVSSDKVSPPTLTLAGFNKSIPNTGLIIDNLPYLPPNITVTSSRNDETMGSVTVPVEVDGEAFLSVPIQVIASADSDVVAGDEVILDGSKSSGQIKSYLWTQTSGPPVTLIDADKAVAKFTAPQPSEPNATLVFALTITGTNDASAVSIVEIKLSAAVEQPTIADAGPAELTVNQGQSVTLDGSTSTGATEYSWKLISGDPVTINGSNSAQATFTVPKKLGTWVFELTATGPGGPAKDTITIKSNPDSVSVILAELRGSEWRVDGTSSVFGPGVSVTIYLEDATATRVGTASVDTFGTWRFRGIGPVIRQGQTITVKSSSGGEVKNVTVRVR